MPYSATLAKAHVSGELAQMVERSLSMREVRGSMPRFSKSILFSYLRQLYHYVRYRYRLDR